MSFENLVETTNARIAEEWGADESVLASSVETCDKCTRCTKKDK